MYFSQLRLLSKSIYADSLKSSLVIIARNERESKGSGNEGGCAYLTIDKHLSTRREGIKSR